MRPVRFISSRYFAAFSFHFSAATVFSASAILAMFTLSAGSMMILTPYLGSPPSMLLGSNSEGKAIRTLVSVIFMLVSFLNSSG